eukprot:TRINITY_DN2966_c0_g1_i1.p9 TRINITY_DN2966_c0_g1~~TRINITY_DN2966_c0_g1_i1.p9  ORF type:complete len:204 (+),score=24.24 TRINITY_DN2966_c0_g1_i1:4984-5595(+)
MKKFLILSFCIALVLCQGDWGAEIYEMKNCGDKNSTYKLHAIDAIPKKENMTNCTYKFVLEAGECKLETKVYSEFIKNYICISEASEPCDIAPDTIAGKAIIECEEESFTDTFAELGDPKPGQEVVLKGDHVNVRVAIGYACKVLTPEETIIWEPRQCIVTEPGPQFGVSFSYAIHTGLALALVLLTIFLQPIVLTSSQQTFI